jgi:membrane associated rhomboid family serine protease
MRSSGGGGGFGFAGAESMAARLAIGLVAGSVLFALLQAQGALLLLVPNLVFQGFRLWQPFTYVFVESDPVGVIFSALIIYSTGGMLESFWGSRRLLQVAFGGTVLAGVVTAVLGLFLPLPMYAGGNVMATIIWVAFGLSIGRGQTNFWGVPVSGNALAGIGAGFILLSTIFYGLASRLPGLISLILVFAYMRGGSPRSLMLRLQHWRLQRQLRGRSRHLRVISEERPGSSDKYLN